MYRRKDKTMGITRRRLFGISAGLAGLALLDTQTFGLTPVATAAAAPEDNLQPLIQRVVDLPSVEISFYVDLQQPGQYAKLILKRPDTIIGSPYVFQDLGPINPAEKAEIVKWLGGELDEWSAQKEELGTAWLFKAKNPNQPVRLRVPFGGLDFDSNGPATAWSWVNCTVATWRPKNPTSTRLVQQQPPAAAPTTPACEKPDALASRMGWKSLGYNGDPYGGFRIELKANADLPAKWEANKEPNSSPKITENQSNRTMDPGTWIIYSPYSCRGPLGFK